MLRFITLFITLAVLAGPAQATLLNFDISGVARSNNAQYGVTAGERLSGSISLDGDVRHGKGKTGNVDSFEFRIGNTVFDNSSGKFNVSYEIRNNELFRLKINAKTQEFKKDSRQFLLNLTSRNETLKAKDLGKKWLHINHIEVERVSLFTSQPGVGASHITSSVPEPGSLIGLVASLGLLAAAASRRRQRR